MPSTTQAAPSTHPGAFRMFRVAGISVFLHYSWLLVAGIELRERNAAYSSQAWNIIEYLSIFAIVLLHEFGHAFACRSVGGRADRIVLWPLGGIAYVDPPRRPGAVLWSIAAGPLVNVALLPFFFGLILIQRQFMPDASNNFQHFLDFMAEINLTLLVFNMLPVYPLDGGQVLQSILWFFIGEHRSLRAAAIIGLIGAGAGIVVALYIGNYFLVAIAVFAAWRSWQGVQIAKALGVLRAIPRHTVFHCPNCHESPPVGELWRCQCGNSFDTFAATFHCPHCGTVHERTACPLCRVVSPSSTWQAP